MMNLALNNASNVEQYYKGLGEKVEIERHLRRAESGCLEAILELPGDLCLLLIGQHFRPDLEALVGAIR